MDSHVTEYYKPYSEDSPHSHFHAVIPLHENPILDWKEISEIAPQLGRGWYELSRLTVQDRIEFSRDFWLAKMPYHPTLTEFLHKFFSSLDDIGIFLTQQKYDDPFRSHFIYSLSHNSGFFHGESPATESEIVALQKVFPNYILPSDYLAFLQIHNGFAKLNDSGILKSVEMEENYLEFQKMLKKEDNLMTSSGHSINPKSLIPFYQSFGMPFFQCFWGEWYPGNEMGNVYYSNITNSISDCTRKDFGIETMAFETFTDWLMFYLETIE